MQFIKHKSGIFNFDANWIALVGYFILSIGLGFPAINQIAIMVCLVVFVVEKKSYMVQFHVVQAAFLGMFIELLRSIGIFVVSWLWQLLSLSENTVQMLLLGIIYGTVLTQAAISLIGIVSAFRWKIVKFPLVGRFTSWLLGRWPTGVKKEEYLSLSGKDGVGIKDKM